MFYSCGGDFSDGGFKFELFVVKGGAPVPYLDICDDKECSHFFEFAVWNAVFSKQFSSSHFEPYWIYGVVYDAGLVGFTISRYNSDDV